MKKKKYKYILEFAYNDAFTDIKEIMVRAESMEKANELVHSIMDSDKNIKMGGSMTLRDYGLIEYRRNQPKRKMK